MIRFYVVHKKEIEKGDTDSKTRYLRKSMRHDEISQNTNWKMFG